jgi:hypothetical protein
MAKRTYKRDKRGRFASTGTKSSRQRIKIKKQRKRLPGSKTVGVVHIQQDKHGNVTIIKKKPRSKRKIAKRVGIGAVIAGTALSHGRH